MLWTDIQYSITTKFWLVEIRRKESQKSFSHLNWKIDLWIDQIKHTIIFIDYMNYSFLARLTQSHVKYCHHFVSVLSIICKLFTLSSSFPRPLVQLKLNFVWMFIDRSFLHVFFPHCKSTAETRGTNRAFYVVVLCVGAWSVYFSTSFDYFFYILYTIFFIKNDDISLMALIVFMIRSQL